MHDSERFGPGFSQFSEKLSVFVPQAVDFSPGEGWIWPPGNAIRKPIKDSDQAPVAGPFSRRGAKDALIADFF